MKYHLYILLSIKTGKYYIGSTGNLKDRLLCHNSGRSIATKSGIPWRFVYSVEFFTRSEAIKRELELKSWKSHERITSFINKV
jgi:putative endonuclease